jgi:hypothetical protein
MFLTLIARYADIEAPGSIKMGNIRHEVWFKIPMDK